jgi:tetrahydromethanopterin S-methyltransferase subunit G
MNWLDWLLPWRNQEDEAQDEDDDHDQSSSVTEQAVKTIVNKIETLTESFHSKLNDHDERFETLEARLDDIEAQADDESDDEERVTQDELNALQDRVDDLEETIESFTGVYEAISSQYNPLINKDEDDEPKQAAPANKEHHENEPKPTEENQSDVHDRPQDGENITIKDNLTNQQEEFTLGQEPSKNEEERRQAKLQDQTPDQPNPVSDQQDTQRQGQHPPPHHNQQPVQQPGQQPSKEQTKQQPRDHTQDNLQQTTPQPADNTNTQNHDYPQDTSSVNHESQTEDEYVEIGTPDQTTTSQQPNNTSQQHTSAQNPDQTAGEQTTVQDKLLRQLINKKRNNNQLTVHAADGEEFYVDGHDPLRDVLDLASLLTDNPAIFKQHVLRERNFEDWIAQSLDMPGLADDLQRIRDREDYITTLLAAV